MNTVTPVFILLLFLLLLKFLRYKSVLIAIPFGITLFVICLFEPTPLVAGLIFIAFLFYRHNKDISYKQILIFIAASLLVFFFVFLFLVLYFNYNLFSNFNFILNDAKAFNAYMVRPYNEWIFGNLKDFFINIGIPQAILLVVGGMFYLARKARKSSKKLCSNNISCLVVSFLLTLLVLDLIGINRGETIRLWIFMAAFLQIIAAYFLRKVRSNFLFYVIVFYNVLQIIVCFSSFYFVYI